MINRELIRIKEVQAVYSFCLNEGMKFQTAENELLKSLSLSYDLYNQLLLLLVEVHRMAASILEIREHRSQRLGDGTVYGKRFVENRFLLQLASNKQLRKYAEVPRFSWVNYSDFVRSLYKSIEDSAAFQEYMSESEDTFQADREVCRKLYKTLLCSNEELDEILEAECIYWNDDKTIVDTFVLKTINRFTEETTPDQPLLPEFKSEEDREFAITLLHRAISNSEYYQSLIAKTTRRWDVNRVALMDRVILQVALAEIISFPTIPVSVSINEYLEIAKVYGSLSSSKYINATLDAIVKMLREEGKLLKKE